MTRRFAAIMSLLVLGLAGCTTYGDSYYRDGYYSDGGYYYPAEDGYGDYYQGRELIDYSYSSYTPFWTLDRYSCGAFYTCSPYWNNFYRRPYSSWSISYGRSWGGWYGNHWSPWYGNHWSPWYGHHWSPWYGHGRHPGRRDRDHDRRDRDYDRDRERRDRPVVGPEPQNPDLRLVRPDFRDDARPRPRPDGRYVRPAYDEDGARPRTPPQYDDVNVRPVPLRRAVDDNPEYRKAPVRIAPDRPGAGSEPARGGFERTPTAPGTLRPSEPPPRFERVERSAPPPRFEQVERPAPPPRAVERAAPPEVRAPSQNRSVDEEL